MIILGIDPGLATVGYGIIKVEANTISIIDYGVIKTPANQEVVIRLKTIYDSILFLIKKHSVNEVAIEELFFNKNTSSALNVAQSRGACILAAINITGKVYEYTPLQIKQALTGYGRADKKQIQYMIKNILNLDKIPTPVDAADAIACAITHNQTNSKLK